VGPSPHPPTPTLPRRGGGGFSPTMTVMTRLASKVALITEGANGIGLETARLFIAARARMLIAGIDQARLQTAGDELGDATATAIADVTDSDQVRAAVQAAVARFGHLDVVVSNAGISGAIGTPVPDYPEDVFLRVLHVHVLGAFLVLKHAL